MKRLSRRTLLRGLGGLGGLAVGLPLLESFPTRQARAASATPPFVIFVRQANGVACEGVTDLGTEPERFWPKNHGVLDLANVSGRALEELADHLPRLLVVDNVHMQTFDYGDGHARGAMQALTARGPVVAGAAGDSEAAGESLNHRIAAELNAVSGDSLFLYAGKSGGWLGGPCISYRAAGQRQPAIHDPLQAYLTVVGSAAPVDPTQAKLHSAVNQRLREKLQKLLAHPRMSTSDKQRLDLHLQSIRDLEVALTCKLSADQEQALQQLAPGFDSDDGDEVLETLRLHMEIAALAVACGYTRSVAIQVGAGFDQATYVDPDTGLPMADNFHYVSHRHQSHDFSGPLIPGSDLMHAKIDRQFAKAIKHLLDRLSQYTGVDGTPLLDAGMVVWYNDIGAGPTHTVSRVPWVIAGSAGGFLKQGQFIQAGGSAASPNHAKLLNTIGSAVGLRKPDDSFLDDFGDPSLPKGLLTELMV